MAAVDVLEKLANSNTKLSDALRSAMLLPEVRADVDLLAWVEREVAGYGEDIDAVPDYRRRDLKSVADASNGAWRHHGVQIPTESLPDDLKGYASQTTHLVQSIGTLEGLLESEHPTFEISWHATAVAKLNWAIRQGTTGLNRTYQVSDARWDVPRPVVQEILEVVRHRVLAEITKRVPVEQLAARIADELPAAPSHVAIQGSGNQVIVGSPGAAATLTVDAGDWTRLNEALLSLGIEQPPSRSSGRSSRTRTLSSPRR